MLVRTSLIAYLLYLRGRYYLDKQTFPCFVFWLLLMTAIWFFLLGWARIVSGTFSPTEIAMTVIGLGRFMVRRTTIRKRMRVKLRAVKQQLHKRMHDPVPQTGQWLKSVVQGYFNYYAVPGNLTSLGVFRDRVLALWWRNLRRRSQKRRVSWTRILVLAQRWLPQPRALHPFPDARFATSHPR